MLRKTRKTMRGRCVQGTESRWRGQDSKMAMDENEIPQLGRLPTYYPLLSDGPDMMRKTVIRRRLGGGMPGINGHEMRREAGC